MRVRVKMKVFLCALVILWCINTANARSSFVDGRVNGNCIAALGVGSEHSTASIDFSSFGTSSTANCSLSFRINALEAVSVEGIVKGMLKLTTSSSAHITVAQSAHTDQQSLQAVENDTTFHGPLTSTMSFVTRYPLDKFAKRMVDYEINIWLGLGGRGDGSISVHTMLLTLVPIEMKFAASHNASENITASCEAKQTRESCEGYAVCTWCNSTLCVPQGMCDARAGNSTNNTSSRPISMALMAGAMVLVGIVAITFGYRLFYITLFCGGFGVGAVCCYVVLFHTTALDLLHRVLLSGGCGVVVGILALFLVTAGIFMFGALSGALVGTLVMLVLETTTEVETVYLVLALCSLCGGVVALVVQKPLIVLGTSIAGSYLFCSGVYFFVEVVVTGSHKARLNVLWEAVVHIVESHSLRAVDVDFFGYIALVLIVVLTVVGVVFQYRCSSKHYHHHHHLHRKWSGVVEHTPLLLDIQ